MPGSISVDCGSNANFVDSVRNISWVSDDEYITNGVNGDVPSAQTYYPDFSEFKTVRYFPDSLAKNCYRFAAMPNLTYVIRGIFFYGSYDNATKLPSFRMAIDGTVVANVTFDDPTIFVYHEITFMTQLNNVTFLCLLRDSSNSVPFISAIFFWSLPDGFWNVNGAAILGEGVILQDKIQAELRWKRTRQVCSPNYPHYHSMISPSVFKQLQTRKTEKPQWVRK